MVQNQSLENEKAIKKQRMPEHPLWCSIYQGDRLGNLQKTCFRQKRLRIQL